VVDMEDFLPALKEAFEGARIPLRAGVASAPEPAVIQTAAQL